MPGIASWAHRNTILEQDLRACAGVTLVCPQLAHTGQPRTGLRTPPQTKGLNSTRSYPCFASFPALGHQIWKAGVTGIRGG